MTETLPFPAGSRLVAYLRDSGGRDQELSVTQQEKAVGQWCRAHGYVLSRLFKDEARSGTKTSGRNAFLDMISYLSKDVPEAGVLFWELARFSRDYDDSMYYISDLRRQGYVVHSMTDNIPQGLDGRLLESIVAWKNAKFSEDLRKNIKRGQAYVVNVHHAFLGNRPPFGYKSVAVQIGKRRDGQPHIIHQLELNPEEAPIARRAFEMRAGGATYAEIDHELHIHKMQNSYGRMFRNQAYIGKYDYSGGIVEGFCEPIVDQALWGAVQRVNGDRRDRAGYNHPRSVRSRFSLIGMIYCGRCGKRLQSRISNNPYSHQSYPYYGCYSFKWPSGYCGARLIPKSEIEERIIQVVLERILVPDVLQDLYDDITQDRDQKNTTEKILLDRLNSEYREVKASITRIVSAIRDVGYSTALLHELEELEGKELELRGRIAQLQNVSKESDELPDLAGIIEATSQALKIASEQQKAMIIRGFIEKIMVEKLADGNLQGEIFFHFPLAGSTTTKVVSL